MSAENSITVDVVSDVVCPWCFIGQKRLDKAIAAADVEVHVRWRPFQLDPTIPPDGMDRRQYMLGKFGSEERIQILAPVAMGESFRKAAPRHGGKVRPIMKCGRRILDLRTASCLQQGHVLLANKLSTSKCGGRASRETSAQCSTSKPALRAKPLSSSRLKPRLR